MKNKIKVILTKLSKKSKLLRTVIRKLLKIYRTNKYKKASEHIILNNKMIMFCSFNGKNYADSPKAIYEYMLKSGEYKDYKFVWVFQNPEEYEYLKNDQTIIVGRNTFNYLKYLHMSKYWVFNYKIADFITPSKEQVFLQCWHGTPLKRLGYDLLHYDNSLNTVKEMQARYKDEASKFNYLISPSKYATDCFTSAWNLKATNRENTIIETGYPRNDVLINHSKKDVTEIKKKILKDDSKTKKKIILYAPTYRPNEHVSGVGYTYETNINFNKLKKELGDKYIILFRAHYFIANSFNFKKYKGFVYDASNVDDINDLYLISDILITDYSSVFFDYANLKRPMIFYMYDLEHYETKSNGFYFDIKETLPGPIVTTEKELIKAIKEYKKEEYVEKYEQFNQKFNYLDDGNCSKRVVDILIGEKNEQDND